MAKNDKIGEFEELILMAVARLGENADAVGIRDTVEEVAERRTSFGAIYTTLDRLEEKGFIKIHQGGPSLQRGGRTRRFYRMEGAGVLALTEAQQVRERMMSGVNLDLRPLGGMA